VKELVATGIVPDESMLYWDIRPSARYPTLEFRIGDMCTRLDDAVAYAGVVRSLTRTLAGQAGRGEPVPRLHAEVLRAARWRAARDGLTGDLYDPVEGRLRPAADVVRRLLALLRADLTANGEWDEVSSRVEAVLADGTSADGQRRALAESGDLGAVSRWVLDRSF
jgi:gamma-glutamyl:cysteine ligase YbdK (ATP-grasp superfamily)